MLGHGMKQFCERGTAHWLEGGLTAQGMRRGFLWIGRSQLHVDRKRKGCMSHKVPGWGHLAWEQGVEVQEGECDVGIYGRKEGDLEPMKRTIFCGAQEGPLTGDFLHGAPGLGCLPRERWCLLWGL